MSFKKSKIKKYCSDEISSSCTSSDSSSDEETDARDLKSIKEYMSDRRELAKQLFKSVKPDKIRMMLPQILKKIDLQELEELCANELSGMSKKRITSIINAQPMLESSDTNESDDSGPSLEIISDTDDLLSDDLSKKDSQSKNVKSTVKKVSGKSKNKIHSQKNINDKGKSKVKTEPKDKLNKSKVKVEGEKDSSKEKEGDSLLDLLELEMRARAIRALIRKEEDIIPSTSNGPSSTLNTKELDKKISMAKEQVINEFSSQQLENIMAQTEDEDVVLVVNPTPVIELLSSDDENEENNEKKNSPKMNQTQSDTCLQKCSIANKETDSSEKLSIDGNKNSVSGNTEDSTINGKEERNIQENKNIREEKSKEKKNSDGNDNTSFSKDKCKKDEKTAKETLKQKSKKVKRKSRKKSREKSDNTTTKKVEKVENLGKKDEKVSSNLKEMDQSSSEKIVTETAKVVESTGKVENFSEKKDPQLNDHNKEIEPKRCLKRPERKIIDNDLEEIIDLDDYPDDMDEIDDDKIQKKSSPEKRANETWASRYYKTDDVQNVIKESKIQSEIRKRLRERQRLCKINNSPTNIEKQVEVKVPTEELNPIGSVQEYLALKATMLSYDLPSSSAESVQNLSKDVVSNDKENKPEVDKINDKVNETTKKEDITTESTINEIIINDSVTVDFEISKHCRSDIMVDPPICEMNHNNKSDYAIEPVIDTTMEKNKGDYAVEPTINTTIETNKSNYAVEPTIDTTTERNKSDLTVESESTEDCKNENVTEIIKTCGTIVETS